MSAPAARHHGQPVKILSSSESSWMSISVSCDGWWLQTLNIVLTVSFCQFQSQFWRHHQGAETRCRTGLQNRFDLHLFPSKLEKEPASLLPVQSPPQHERQCRPGREIRQGVECNAFITTRYCSFRLWITGMKDSQGISVACERPFPAGSTTPTKCRRRQALDPPIDGVRELGTVSYWHAYHSAARGCGKASGGHDRKRTSPALNGQPLWPLAIGS